MDTGELKWIRLNDTGFVAQIKFGLEPVEFKDSDFVLTGCSDADRVKAFAANERPHNHDKDEAADRKILRKLYWEAKRATKSAKRAAAKAEAAAKKIEDALKSMKKK